MVTTGSAAVAERTFLLVHGIGMGIACFARLGSDLESHGQQVAIDLPGCGDAPVPRLALTMAQRGTVLIAFVEVEDLGKPVLVGQSMETQMVVEAAAQHPDPFPEVVPVAPPVNQHERPIPKHSLHIIQDVFRENPRVRVVGMRNDAKTGPGRFIKKLKSMMDHDVEDSLPKITAHTPVVRGKRDPVCPHGWGEEAIGLIPGARMGEVAGRGHETMVKDGSCVAGGSMEFVRIS